MWQSNSKIINICTPSHKAFDSQGRGRFGMGFTQGNRGDNIIVFMFEEKYII